MGDRRGVGAAGDLHPRRDRLAQHLAGPGEHLGRLGLELGRGLGDVEAFGEVAGGDEEGAVLDHRADRVVGGQRAVLYAVHAGPDAGADGGVTVSVSGDSDSGPMGLVHDGRELLVRVLLRASLAAV